MRPNYIYFVSTDDGAKIKVGMSYNPIRRMSQVQTWSPYRLKIVATTVGTIDDERVIHKAFFAHRSHGEWFNSHPDILAAISFINEHGVLPEHLRGTPGQASIMWKFGKRTNAEATQ